MLLSKDEINEFTSIKSSSANLEEELKNAFAMKGGRMTNGACLNSAPLIGAEHFETFSLSTNAFNVVDEGTLNSIVLRTDSSSKMIGVAKTPIPSKATTLFDGLTREPPKFAKLW